MTNQECGIDARQSGVGANAESIYADFRARQDAGERIDFEALVRRHPEHESELRGLCADYIRFGKSLEEAAPAPLQHEARDQDPLSQAFAQADSAVEFEEPSAPPMPRPAEELLDRLSAHRWPSKRYQFRARIGQGGQGVVLKAWDKDLGRPIAMKFVMGRGETVLSEGLPHVDSATLARFLDEAQITGQLDHPGIVPMHEMGVHSTGRAYFTMRLLRGETLEKLMGQVHRREGDWTRERALNVILRACEAISYAHSRRVIHRDLKPANIMVGPFGEVCVMDWGLARVLGQPDRARESLEAMSASRESVHTLRDDIRQCDSDSRLLTEYGEFLGTPEYSPPEQAAGQFEELDERADVYAIGATLYHLIAGVPRHVDSCGRLRDAAKGVDRALAVERLRELVARLGSEAPHPLTSHDSSAPHELIAIVEKAMAIRPEVRYRDMRELSADLRAFLERRVVRAYEVGPWAETKKWMGRNSALAVALASVVLVAVVGAVASQLNANKAARREREALISARRATQITDFVQRALIRSDLYSTDGRSDYLVKDAMRVAVAELDRGNLREHPDVQANLRLTIARILSRNGGGDEALALARHALGEYVKIHGDDHADVALAFDTLGGCLHVVGRYEEALGATSHALSMYRRLLNADDKRIALSMNELGECLRMLRRPEEALPVMQASLEMLQRILPHDDIDLATALNNVGTVLEECGRADEALPFLERSLDMSRRMCEGDHPLVASSLNNIAVALDSLGQWDAALERYLSALAMRQRLFAYDHPDLVTNLNNVGYCLLRMGCAADALSYYRRALEMRRRLIVTDHDLLARSINNLGRCWSEVGRHDEALPLLQEALIMRQRIVRGDDELLAQCEDDVGVCLLQLRRASDALPFIERSLSMRRRLHPGDHEAIASSLNNLAWCLRGVGRTDEAVGAFRAAASMWERVHSEAHIEVLVGLRNVAATLLALDRNHEALECATRLVEIASRELSEGDPLRREALKLLDSVHAAVSTGAK